MPTVSHVGRRQNQSIYLHRSGPLLENGLDRPKNRYGRYGFPSFLQHAHIYGRGGWSQSLPLGIVFLCSLGGGGRYFSVMSVGNLFATDGIGSISVAAPAEPRGEKKLFFVQILGGEKLLKFVEKCR